MSFDPSEEELLCRIRGEFLEMPGLRLTAAQAQRLWGLDYRVCATLLERLIDARFLARSTEGLYMRLGDGVVSQLGLRMLKADLDREAGRQRRGG